MATVLNLDAVAAVNATRAKGRPESDYANYVKNAAAAGKPLGNCEADFAEVKPAHVIHMFRKVLKANPALAQVITAGRHDEFGICLIPVAAAKAA